MKIQKSVMFIKKKLKNKYLKDKKYGKLRDQCHYTGEYRHAGYSICNLKYSVPKKIAIVFHNDSNYDYHFIIKFHYCKKVFILMNIWMIGKNSMKYHYFKKKIYTVT